MMAGAFSDLINPTGCSCKFCPLIAPKVNHYATPIQIILFIIITCFSHCGHKGEFADVNSRTIMIICKTHMLVCQSLNKLNLRELKLPSKASYQDE